jgi:hypothetical protein
MGFLWGKEVSGNMLGVIWQRMLWPREFGTVWSIVAIVCMLTWLKGLFFLCGEV